MSARTRKTFKERIGPRLARSKRVRRARFLVVTVLLADTTKEEMRRFIKRTLEAEQPCPVKVQSLTDSDRVVTDSGFARRGA